MLKRSIMNPLEVRMGYKFRNGLLLAEALTHPSISLERKDYPFDNQRLEFLGDAVIQIAVTEHLFRMFPDFSEGRLTKLRTRIVSRTALRERGLALDLGSYLMMGRGEEASGGRERSSTLADAFESVVGAIFLDGGFEAARMFLLQQMDETFAVLAGQPEEINPKGILQELLQALAPNAPEYELLSQTGPEHSKKFVCRVLWNGIELGSGEGLSKKEAQVAAAARALAERPWEKETRKPAQKKKLEMIYQLPLYATGLAAGAFLIFSHAFALAREESCIAWAREFPRSRPAATVLLAVAAVWSFWLVSGIDLGEFSPLRNVMLVAITAGAVLSWIYVPEFLAVRALGMLLLLAAEPLLESAVLRTEPTRLLLVVLAYEWAIAGLFFVGMPYLLRDAVAWVTASPLRWKAAAAGGVAWGIALVACALLIWNQ